MPTAAELVVGAEFADLEEVAAFAGWTVAVLNTLEFVVGLKAADGSPFWVICEADGYKATPPAWRWCDPQGGERDQLHSAPRAGGSAFLHDSGVICAPWNRLAYKTVDARGPHSDWTIGNWQDNGYTGACKTLTAMVIRIEIELKSRIIGRVLVAA
ncbi:MAG TPA: hypothetical protein VFC47_00350 [Caulobacteraceae bacterium]|nr:hypothetical protein [Caulobacteraceae bacterium]